MAEPEARPRIAWLVGGAGRLVVFLVNAAAQSEDGSAFWVLLVLVLAVPFFKMLHAVRNAMRR